MRLINSDSDIRDKRFTIEFDLAELYAMYVVSQRIGGLGPRRVFTDTNESLDNIVYDILHKYNALDKVEETFGLDGSLYFNSDDNLKEYKNNFYRIIE